MLFGPKPSRRESTRTRLGVESLEGREVPATLTPIDDQTTPNTKVLYVPLNVSNVTGAVTYNATSSDSRVQAQLVTGGSTIKMNVSGTAADGTPFQGDLTFRLFDDLAPVTVARIKTLVGQGFYNNLTFHRILKGFVAQGGDPAGNGTGGSGTKIDDEFSTDATFNSRGLLAMANSGHDTGDSQFFVTDLSLTLAQQPQHLNFKHTIFGQLVGGFDTFNKLINTPVTSPSTGSPVTPVRINTASVVTGDPNGVLKVTAPADFTGSSTITVNPADGGSASTGDSFAVNFVADTVDDPPFLGPIGNQTGTAGSPTSFTLTATDLERDNLTFAVKSATSGGSPVTVNPQIDQATGRVTVTPPSGFTGTIDLLVGVKDPNGGEDTQVVKLTVGAAQANNTISLDTGSDTGIFTDDKVTGTATPTLTIKAAAGRTVAVTVNGTAAGNATASATAGTYTITLPANLLQVGANTIAGSVTGGTGAAESLTASTVTYQPGLKSFYVVPGAIGSSQQLTVQLSSLEAKNRSEVGYFKVDDTSGKIGTLRPTDAGYYAAAMARRQIAFATTAASGTSNTITAAGGDVLVMYLVQNRTSTDALARNPTNAVNGTAFTFFGLSSANPDAIAHLAAVDDPASSQVVYGWEDILHGGDRDFNDVVMSVRPVGASLAQTLQVPGALGRAVTTLAQLEAATKARTSVGNTPSPANSINGEVGVIVTDDAAGKIGALGPGDAGYAASALGRAASLFPGGSMTSTSTTLTTLTSGQFVMFYYVPNGTAAGARTANPTNSGTGGSGTVAFFSIPAANPDGVSHSRLMNPEGISRALPAATDPTRVHMMGKLNGVAADFDDVVFNIRFTA